jgi:hypothetical protein
MSLLWVALAGTAAPTHLAAQDIVLQGRVLRIIDGDTVRVSLSSGPINIRLHATDAPERRQPWGPEATVTAILRDDDADDPQGLTHGLPTGILFDKGT